MSDNRTIMQSEGDRLAAAEYVLGVLGAADRWQVQQRLIHDQVFAAEVAFWEERLGSLAEAVAPVAPPERAWRRIAKALRLPDDSPPRESLWQSLTFWRSFAIGSAALAAASLGALTFIEISPPRAPMLATLGGSTGQPNFVAAVGAGGTSMLVVPAALLAADQRAYELWLIPSGDKPHSLGLVEPGRPVRIDVPRDLAGRITPDTEFAVSIEPLGGSPTGQPTGPVIASGKLLSL